MRLQTLAENYLVRVEPTESAEVLLGIPVLFKAASEKGGPNDFPTIDCKKVQPMGGTASRAIA
jgi:hypothetical protein